MACCMLSPVLYGLVLCFVSGVGAGAHADGEERESRDDQT